MAVNPMQRKTRNSFLLGMMLTLIITGAIIVLLFMQVKNMKDERLKELAQMVNVYTLNREVKSGEILTKDVFTKISVNKNTVPVNATSLSDVIDSWFLQTSDGDDIYKDEIGLYIKGGDKIVEVYIEGGNYYKQGVLDESGKPVQVRASEVKADVYGSYIVDENDTITRIYENSIGNYYKCELVAEKLTTSGTEYARKKIDMVLSNTPVIAKLDMGANTVMTAELVQKSDAKITNDVRIEEYNMLSLPMDLETDDYVDIRLWLPTGQNFIVISKKQVAVPEIDGVYVSDTIQMNLREDEILIMSSAIVEAYKIDGAKLYAIKYADPGMQDAAMPTYVPNEETTVLINNNPNLIAEAKEALKTRYSDGAKYIRNDYLNSAVNSQMNAAANAATGLNESITNSQSTRKKYLDSLGY